MVIELSFTINWIVLGWVSLSIYILGVFVTFGFILALAGFTPMYGTPTSRFKDFCDSIFIGVGWPVFATFFIISVGRDRC